MRIAIWYRPTIAPFGGSNNFLRRLGLELERMGHDVYFGHRKDVDIILVNAFVRGPNELLKIGEIAQLRTMGRVTFLCNIPLVHYLLNLYPRKGIPIIHRVDGVTYLYGRKTDKADKLALAINRFADMTVFQSKFCMDSFMEYGMRPSMFEVINNGVPLDIFYPLKNKKNLGKTLRLISTSWSNNPMKGFATLAKISEIPNVSLRFIGNWPNSVDPRRVVILGKKPESEVAGLLRNHDAFVHAAINEPSSNAIIEALASGLPILFENSGGNAELVKDCGIPISSDIRVSIDAIRTNYQALREKVETQRERFSITFVAHRYINTIIRTYESVVRGY